MLKKKILAFSCVFAMTITQFGAANLTFADDEVMPGGQGFGSEAEMASGGPPQEGAPDTAAIYISGNAEDASKEVSDDATLTKKNAEGEVKDGVYTITGLELSSDNYETNGVIITGEASNVELDGATISLGIDSKVDTTNTGGDAVILDDGAKAKIKRLLKHGL